MTFEHRHENKSCLACPKDQAVDIGHVTFVIEQSGKAKMCTLALQQYVVLVQKGLSESVSEGESLPNPTDSLKSQGVPEFFSKAIPDHLAAKLPYKKIVAVA